MTRTTIDFINHIVEEDDIRKSAPSPAAMKSFAGGVGCAAIVAALIYTKQQKPRIADRSE